MKILLVSFPTHPADSANPGEELLRLSFPKEVTPLLLPFSWAKSKEKLLEAIRNVDPDAVLILNLCPYRKEPALEQYAFNAQEGASLEKGEPERFGEPIEKDGPKSLSTSLNLEGLRIRLAQKGIPSTISFDGGRYLDNQAYYLALKEKKQALLLHLPRLEDLGSSEQKEVLEETLAFAAD